MVRRRRRPVPALLLRRVAAGDRRAQRHSHPGEVRRRSYAPAWRGHLLNAAGRVTTTIAVVVVGIRGEVAAFPVEVRP